MPDFNELFNSYTNAQLLRILENSDDYKPHAVDTAREILSRRQLSDKEMEAAHNELLAEKQAALAQTQKINKVVSLGNSVVDSLNPIQTKAPSAEKIIRYVTIGFVILCVFEIVKDFDTIWYAITDSSTEWDFSMLLYFCPMVIIPVATYLFYKRKKAGWILLSIILTYIASGALSLFALTFNEDPSESMAFENTFPPISPVTYLLSLIVFGGTLIVISNKNIRSLYRIERKSMYAIVIPVAILTILINLGMFL
ncbi:MAG TPA: hypothetical protein VHO90_19955 [Bacteroidales bacterium]|nr:hypothetical protein [Bacteroidales bacterium]